MGTFYKDSKWPRPDVRRRWEEVDHNSKLRLNDERYIRSLAIAKGMGGDFREPYFLNPLPATMTKVSANLLFGEPFALRYDDPADQNRADEMRRRNQLDGKAKAAAQQCAGDGGIWWRCWVDPSTPRGRNVVGMGFVSELRVVPKIVEGEVVNADLVHEFQLEKGRVLRHLERNVPGFLENLVYIGTKSDLGEEIPFARWGEYEDENGQLLMDGVPEAYETRIDAMPLGYAPNMLATDSPYGVSDFDGLLDFFLALNRTSTLTHETLEALLPTLIADKQFLNAKSDKGRRRGLRDKLNGIKVWEVNRSSADRESGVKPYEVIQGDYDAETFISLQLHLLDQALMHSGYDPQIVGRLVQGTQSGPSGVALRLQMTRSLIQASGKAQFFSEGLAEMFRIAALLDQKTVGVGRQIKRGHAWANPEQLPDIELRDGLPDDPMEDADIQIKRINAAAAAKGSGLADDDRALQIAYPDMSEQEREELAARTVEQDAIVRQQIASTQPSAPGAADLLGGGSLFGS